ncbi:hypothetical protein LOTGIDRAFT_239402 [Lottia gigantea]|uniref:Transmembrane protein 254 n=1 Tax=Lottia gigantea TaxID=225164 RepID=V3ZWG5_LOTGI|nr:hypothetical protein LOTGIDRAFT_239402 [Lottia gigantea]ESO95838.1 hypothetical protein LOTGIDRAFT_239402 [Lottia gigantea]
MATKDQAKRKTEKVQKIFFDEFFVLPHPLWMIIISFGLWLLVTTTITPDKVPSFLGPLATFSRFLGKSHPLICNLICIFTVLAHCGEALYASKLCQDKGMSVSASIKWTLSTMIFGFSSLIRLKPHKSTAKIE